MLTAVACLGCTAPALAAGQAHATAALSTATADAAIKAQVRKTSPRADFPAAEGAFCPAVEIRAGRAECFAEYHVGDRWHIYGAFVSAQGGALRLSYVTHASWRRRWVGCSLAGARTGYPARPVRGTLASNNNCGKGQPSADAYYIATEFHPSNYSELGWQFTDSAGFAIGLFHGTKRGDTYTFTNAVGDAFRYTP